jgi:predicted branched-subunit amino acid permease
VRDVLPALPANVPFGIIAGVATVAVGVGPGQAVAFAGLLFAGAAQVAAVELLDQHAPVAVVVLTALVVNLRYLMYSASLATHFEDLSTRWKLVVAYFLLDVTYALSIARFDGQAKPGPDADSKPDSATDSDPDPDVDSDPDSATDSDSDPDVDSDSDPDTDSNPDSESESGLGSDPTGDGRWYYLGTALPLWATWVGASIVGITFGARVPQSWQLDFAIPLLFMGLLFPALDGTPSYVAGGVAGVLAIAGFGLPFDAGILVAAIGGIAAGVVADGVTER